MVLASLGREDPMKQNQTDSRVDALTILLVCVGLTLITIVAAVLVATS